MRRKRHKKKEYLFFMNVSLNFIGQPSKGLHIQVVKIVTLMCMYVRSRMQVCWLSTVVRYCCLLIFRVSAVSVYYRIVDWRSIISVLCRYVGHQLLIVRVSCRWQFDCRCPTLIGCMVEICSFQYTSKKRKKRNFLNHAERRKNIVVRKGCVMCSFWGVTGWEGWMEPIQTTLNIEYRHKVFI